MKKLTTLLFTFLLGVTSVVAQVAFNTDGSVPDNSAILDVKSTIRGVQIPIMTVLQIKYINNPANGLLVFNSDQNCYYFFDDGSGKWKEIAVRPWTCGDTLFDSRDSKSYATVQIGTQCWMAENLNIGTVVSNSGNQIDNSTIEKYCYSNNTSNCDTYGGLYQWAEMVQYLNGATNTTSWNPVPTSNVQGICPNGWYLPTDTEWTTLSDYLGGSSIAGEKLKSTSGWYNNGNGTNSSGFTAFPGGYCYSGGLCRYLGLYGTWWSSSESSDSRAWIRQLKYGYDEVYEGTFGKSVGLSVRCLKD